MIISMMMVSMMMLSIVGAVITKLSFRMNVDALLDSVVDKRFDLHGRRSKVGREAALS